MVSTPNLGHHFKRWEFNQAKLMAIFVGGCHAYLPMRTGPCGEHSFSFPDDHSILSDFIDQIPLPRLSTFGKRICLTFGPR